MKRKQAFTLIELLVVLAIIGALMGMTLAGVMKVREAAWRRKTGETCYQLAAAWESHLTDFRRFPSNSASITEMNKEAIATLNTHSTFNQNIDYLEFTTAEEDNGLKDRWGKLYQVALDAGAGIRDPGGTAAAYDGRVTAGAHSPDPSKQVHKSVAVWSWGPDGVEATEDDSTSWERPIVDGT